MLFRSNCQDRASLTSFGRKIIKVIDRLNLSLDEYFVIPFHNQKALCKHVKKLDNTIRIRGSIPHAQTQSIALIGLGALTIWLLEPDYMKLWIDEFGLSEDDIQSLYENQDDAFNLLYLKTNDLFDVGVEDKAKIDELRELLMDQGIIEDRKSVV